MIGRGETRETHETGIFGGGRFGMIVMTVAAAVVVVVVVAGWAGKGRSEDEIGTAVLEGVEGKGKIEGCTVNQQQQPFNTYSIMFPCSMLYY